MRGTLGAAAGLGAVTGLRSFAAVAILSRELSRRRALARWRRRGTGLERWLTDPVVARAFQVLAAGELLADKLPGVPPRIAPGPLVGRAVIGALVGGLVVAHDRRAAGALAGAGGAVVGAFAGWWLRREAARATALPDAAVAVAEDAVAIATARELVAEL